MRFIVLKQSHLYLLSNMYQRNQTVIPTNMSPHNSSFRQNHPSINNQSSTQYRPQQRIQQFQQRPQHIQYRPRNVPQMNNYRQKPMIQPRPYTQQVQNREEYDGLPSPPGTPNQYILYYSNYCVNSKEFINILCKSPLYNKFTKINISAPNSPIPKFLKYTPTMVVPGSNKPLTGIEVFTWLEAQSAKKEEEKTDEIKPFMPNEMGSHTDCYSYLDLEDSSQPMEHTFVFLGKKEEKINTPPEEDFIDTNLKPVRGDVNLSNRPPLPQAPQHNIAPSSRTNNPIIPQSSGRKSDDKESLDSAYNELLNRRKMDMPPPKQNF
jgi:hypothetical protein